MPKFGLSLSGLLQQTGDGDMVERFADVLTLVRLARELGFDYIYAGQHFLTHPYQMLQPVASLARLAAETGDMDLVTIVLMGLVNPVQMAEDVATLDVITNGRVVVAAALGYREQEYRPFGVARADRLPRMLETLELAKALWAGGEVTYEGRFHRVDGVHIGVRPVQQPHPRIWVTANGDRMVQRIGAMGDVWYLNPHAPHETLARQIELYKRSRAEAGHPPTDVLPVARETFVAETRERAIEIARPFLAAKYETYARWGQDKALPGNQSFDPADTPFEELAEGRFVLGGPEDVVRDLRAFTDLGVTHFSLRFGWPGMPRELVEDTMRLAAAEVFPALR